MTYLFDCDLSPDFNRQKKDLAKKYKRIDQDIQAALVLIAKDYTSVCNATPWPGHGNVWKYRIKNSDAQKGRSGGYRIVILFNQEKGTAFQYASTIMTSIRDNRRMN